MKTVLTGGHITPALAYIEYCKTQNIHNDISFFGRTYSQSNKQQKSIEKKVITQFSIPFYPTDVPKISNILPWSIVLFVYSYLTVSMRICRYLIRIKPDVIITFGGYLAVPVACIGWLLRIPIVTHEQTATAGRANRFIAQLATKIGVSFESSLPFFPKSKTIVTGNPIRQSLLKTQTNPPSWFQTQSKKPILYITGGNQGSHIINTVTKHILRQLTKDFVVIHACGRATTSSNYLQELTKAAHTLPSTHRNRYFVQEWISTNDLGWILQNAELAVSRAGANTIQEFIQCNVPALLVPLPFSYHNEQVLNAKIMTEYGGAITINQKEFTPEKVLETIKTMSQTRKAYKRKLTLIDTSNNAAASIHRLAHEVITHYNTT